MARGKRETFILNELNPKDKLILEFLDNQFNRSETIRDILYEYVKNNHGNAITIPLSNDDNSITNPLQQGDNTFNIDISSLDDDFIDIKTNDKEINASDEALNYLNNWR